MNASKNTSQRGGRTIIDRACREITGFKATYDKLYKNIVVSGKSTSTLNNYCRCIAKLAYHFNADPLTIEDDAINEYLYMLAQNKTPSESYFKHTVYGLRFLYRVFGQDDRAIKLPSLKRDKQLPVVLSKQECRLLFAAPKQLKHRVILALIYSAGLRVSEVLNLKLADIDSHRMQIHIHKGKGGKDRYVVLSKHILRGLRTYYIASRPKEYLFNGYQKGKPLSKRGLQHILRQALKRTPIKKRVTIHTLRHSFATHLLEDGLDLYTIKELLGHSNIQTTLVYLHVAQVKAKNAFSPLDTLYKGS